MEHKIYYLYLIVDLLNSKVYVGQTVSPKKRWSQHRAYAKREKPIQYIHRAMAKYGADNFEFDIIAACKTVEDADEIETQLISQYDSRNKEKGYNIAPGGDTPWNAGLPAEQQPMYGKHHTEESKKKISKSNTGVQHPKHTDEWKKQISEILTGHPTSDEVKRKISLTQKGKPRWTKEQKQKMSVQRKGRKLSEEHKRKIAFAMKKVK